MNTTPLPALPLRQIATSLTDDDLDRLDLFRRSQTELPTRSAILREALRFYLDMQDSPLLVMGALLEGLESLHGAAETDDDRIGETKGSV